MPGEEQGESQPRRRAALVLAALVLALAVLSGGVAAWLVLGNGDPPVAEAPAGDEPAGDAEARDPDDPSEAAPDLDEDPADLDELDEDDDDADPDGPQGLDPELAVELAGSSLVEVHTLSCDGDPEDVRVTGVDVDDGVLTHREVRRGLLAGAVVSPLGEVAEALPEARNDVDVLRLQSVPVTPAPLGLAEPTDDEVDAALVTLGEDGPEAEGVVLDLGTELVDLPVATDPEDRGAPVVDASGDVAAVVVTTGDPTTVATAETLEAIEAPSDGMGDLSACDDPVVPERDLEVTIADDVAHEDADAVAELYEDYFDGINQRDHTRAYERYSADWRDTNTLEGFVEGVATTYYPADPELTELASDGDGLRAQVMFVSIQSGAPEHAPEEGERCSWWTLGHELVEEDGGWRIDGVDSDLSSDPPHAACAE